MAAGSSSTTGRVSIYITGAAAGDEDSEEFNVLAFFYFSFASAVKKPVKNCMANQVTWQLNYDSFQPLVQFLRTVNKVRSDSSDGGDGSDGGEGGDGNYLYTIVTSY